MAKEFKLTSKEIDEAYKKAAEITEGVDWNEDAIHLFFFYKNS